MSNFVKQTKISRDTAVLKNGIGKFDHYGTLHLKTAKHIFF